MTTNPSIFDQLAADADRLVSSPEVRARVPGWARIEPALSGIRSPSEILEACQRQGDRRLANGTLAALVRLAGEDPLAARLVLASVLPGLRAGARRLARSWRTDVDELDQAVVAAAWERIMVLAGTRPLWPATAIVAAARDEVLAGLRRQGRQRRRSVPLDRAGVDSAGVDVLARVEAVDVLSRAVQLGQLSRASAGVIIATRLLGLTPTEIAAATGRQPAAVRTQRQRAERALRAAS